MTPQEKLGQARKSLWIETTNDLGRLVFLAGQARKSLWIETFLSVLTLDIPKWSGS